jgi:ribosomal protein S27AE
MGRARCESYKSIDIREWKREGLLSTPGNYFTVEWSGDHPLGIGVLVGERDADLGIIGSLTLGYRVGRGQPIERPIHIAFTRPKFGGRRPWFFCPRCIGRAAILYFHREDWACRRCCDLGYQSELEAKGRRGLMRARKIQARLGGDRSGFEFPDKPKGMHWRTYERWREKHKAAVAKSWSGFEWSRFARRLGLG